MFPGDPLLPAGKGGRRYGQRSVIRVRPRPVYGTCVASDAARFTALAETMAPRDLANLLDEYFAALFEQIQCMAAPSPMWSATAS